MMPRMSGVDTLKRLNLVEGFNTPVVALTANAITGMKEKYLADGFNDYLSKPIDKNELYRVLVTYIRKTNRIEEVRNDSEITKELKPIAFDYLDCTGKKALIVDDNKINIKIAAKFIENYKFNIDSCLSGEECISFVKEKNYDIIFLDYMMPGMDGYSAVKEIKQIKDIPIIMLSARVEEIDKLQGFSLGIDDYVTKPFSPKELVARIKAVCKRNKDEDIVSVGNITLNKLSRDVTVDGKLVEVTHTQFELLVLFLTNKGIALSRDKIIESLWGYDYEADDRTIDAHIKLLRSKLGKYRNSIKTIRKVGYKFEYEEQ